MRRGGTGAGTSRTPMTRLSDCRNPSESIAPGQVDPRQRGRAASRAAGRVPLTLRRWSVADEGRADAQVLAEGLGGDRWLVGSPVTGVLTLGHGRSG